MRYIYKQREAISASLKGNLNIYNLEPAGALNQTGEEKSRIPALNYVRLVDEINLSH